MWIVGSFISLGMLLISRKRHCVLIAICVVVVCDTCTVGLQVMRVMSALEMRRVKPGEMTRYEK
jgi:hypothetical protein